MRKRCPRCGETKARTAFYPRGHKLSSYCKPCHIETASDWAKANRESRREYNREWARQNPDKVKASKRKTTYGISEDDYAALRLAQNAKCAACHDTLQGGRREAIDHSHESGVVRGILCCWCNKALGHAKENADRLRALASYVEQHAEVIL